MKGVQNFEGVEACKKAILAGVDMFIYRNADEETIDVIEELISEAEKDEQLKAKIIEANKRISELKKLKIQN